MAQVSDLDFIEQARAENPEFFAKPAPPSSGAPVSLNAGSNPAYVTAALQRELDELKGNGPTSHNRNNALNAAAFNLGQLVGGGELAREVVEQHLIDAARSTGLPDGEIDTTLRSGLEAGIAEPRTAPPPTTPTPLPPVTVLEGPPGDADEEWSRWVDLGTFLDGTHTRPEPDVGGLRDDMIQVLYPRRWHTNIALTGAGKTAFALWHVKAVLDAGEHVVYLHFEEFEPDGVIDRLLSFGVDIESIRTRLHWADCGRRWATGEMAHWLTQFEQPPAMAVLDGINAACSQHGWKVSETEAIGAYRAMFVTPLVRGGAAVLSLGHPPKAKDRQNEMHGFGSTAWLDEVDGVGFRMVASKEHPMVIGGNGHSALYVVKDRYSQVKRWGNLDTTKEQPWWYMGAFIVDDSDTQTVVRLNVPPPEGSGQPKGKESLLADHIAEALGKRAGRFETVNQLKGFLAEDGCKYTASHLPVALEMLASQGNLIWPEAANSRSARPGWLPQSSAVGDSK